MIDEKVRGTRYECLAKLRLCSIAENSCGLNLVLVFADKKTSSEALTLFLAWEFRWPFVLSLSSSWTRDFVRF